MFITVLGFCGFWRLAHTKLQLMQALSELDQETDLMKKPA